MNLPMDLKLINMQECADSLENKKQTRVSDSLHIQQYVE